MCIRDSLKDRASTRNISINDIQETLHNPLNVGNIRMGKDGPSKTYVSKKVTVAVNPETGSLITAYKTPHRIREKFKGEKDGN